MLLAVTSATAIGTRFGQDAFSALRPALRGYLEAQRSRGLELTLVRLDDAGDMAAFGLDPVPWTTSTTVRGTIDAICRSQRLRGSPVESVLLLGGDEIIPLCRVPNPVGDRRLDPDGEVLTDNPYGALDNSPGEYLAPSRPVGRLCDGGSIDAFRTVIERLVTNLTTRPFRQGSCAVLNDQWVDGSTPAASRLSPPIEWHVAPAYAVAAGNRSDLDRRVVYANLHGFDGDPAWKAYDAWHDQFLEVMTPESFTADHIAGSVIISEACYGAQITGRTAATSCAIRAQVEGAATVIGATGLVFGSILQPWLVIADADQLTAHLFGRVTPGRPAGMVLTGGRQDFVRSCGTLNPYEYKTALQFLLLGDPSLAIA